MELIYAPFFFKHTCGNATVLFTQDVSPGRFPVSVIKNSFAKRRKFFKRVRETQDLKANKKLLLFHTLQLIP
jgi:hypothetical protein